MHEEFVFAQLCCSFASTVYSVHCLRDHRNSSLREWLVKEHVMGALGMGNSNISGF